MPQLFENKPNVGIVFDSDMAAIDDVLALALLFGFESRDESRVVSVSVSRPDLNAADFCDAMVRFYTQPMPIGMATVGKAAGSSRQPLHPGAIRQLNDTADPAALIRNAFTAQYDGNAAVVLAGPATNLAAVLDLPGARELIAAKVRLLAIAAGDFPTGQPDPNLQSDIPSARKLFAGWPTPIVAAGAEIGQALLFPGASIAGDFSWAPAHPVADAYRAYRPMPYDAPSRALAAALYAVRPEESYFKLSPSGTLGVLDDGRARFAPAAGGRHRYLIADPAQKERIVKVYAEMASARPVPKLPRFRAPAARP